MNILALETSTALLSVALRWEDRVLVRSERQANGGSDRLLPWVRELLDEAGFSLSRLDGIAFGSGPGGFTGIRLACGVAQGLAFGADLPVIGVCGLEAMAAESGAERVYACLDARMNEVYSAAYEMKNGEPVAVLSPAVTPPDQAPLPPDGLWLGLGDGFTAYAGVMQQRLDGRLERIAADALPTAAAVARLAEVRFARGEGLPAAQAQPLYVRDKVALTTAERLARGGVR